LIIGALCLTTRILGSLDFFLVINHQMNLWAPLSYSKLRGQLFFLKRSSILEIFNNLVILISKM